MTIGIGKDIDAWCGPCKRIATHTLIAIVDGQPKQVMCLSCRDRHNYRLEPGRRAAGEGPAPKRRTEPRKLTNQELQQNQKQQEALLLSRELAAATDVKKISRHQVYKSGEIVEHPQYGRGKIENARRDSLLVRFNGGLKSVMIT